MSVESMQIIGQDVLSDEDPARSFNHVVQISEGSAIASMQRSFGNDVITDYELGMLLFYVSDGTDIEHVGTYNFKEGKLFYDVVNTATSQRNVANYKKLKGKMISYAVTINWDELDPDSRKKMIDTYIEHVWEYSDPDSDVKQLRSLRDVLDDPDIRRYAEDYIKMTYFPRRFFIFLDYQLLF